MGRLGLREPDVDDVATVDERGTTWSTADEGALRGGASAGRYVLIEQIGVGGMGVVYRAYDPKLQREIALKFVRAGALAADVQLRIFDEAQAMARLNHPNVVAVYDVERYPQGIALAMEYVVGTPLHRWLRDEPRPWWAVVRTFVDAGRGLAAAHSAGIVHCDFKPANVLVAADGRARVTDFGLARRTDVPPTGMSRGTTTSVGDEAEPSRTRERWIVGTPVYMAPEQELSAGDVDARADQYAFCVALWQGLTGALPFRRETGGLEDLRRSKDRGPPPWPKGLGVPPRIVDAIRRGLSPRPEQRWPAMEPLLDALSFDPRRRRRRWAAAVAAAGLVVASGAVPAAVRHSLEQRCSGAARQLVEIWNPEQRGAIEAAILGTGAPYAADVWNRTGPQLDAYAEQWTELHREACESTNVRVEQTEAEMDLQMRCLYRARTELGARLDLLSHADAEVVAKAHALVDGLPALERCTDPLALQASVPPPEASEAEAVDTIRARLAEARAHDEAGKYDDGLRFAERAMREAEALVYEPVRTEAAFELAIALAHVGDYAGATARARQALDLSLRWGQWDQALESASLLVFIVGFKLAEHDRAAAYYELGRAMIGRSRDFGTELELRSNHGVVLWASGEFGAAEAEFRAVLTLRERALGPEHPVVAQARNNVALVLSAQGKHPEAETEHRAALHALVRALGLGHPVVAQARNNLAAALSAQAKYAEVEQEHREALRSFEAALGSDHPHVALSRSNLGLALLAQGKFAEAETQSREAVRVLDRILGPAHRDTGQARMNLSDILVAQAKYDQAEALVRDVLAVSERTLGPDDLEVAWVRHKLGEIAWKRGDLATASEAFEAAWARRQRDDASPLERAETAFALAQVSWDLGRDRARARRLASEAASLWTSAGDGSAEQRRAVEAWLSAHR